MDAWNISLIQQRSGPSVDDNLHKAAFLVAEAARDARLVVLPELFCTSYQVPDWLSLAEPLQEARYTRFLSGLAREHGVWLCGGSQPELDEGRVYNTATLFSPQGELVLSHRKVHLFDVDIPGGITFFESDFFSPGEEVSVVDTELGTLGLAVCFDVRFPEIFRAMALKGAEVVLLPAAFNTTTGPAHWELQLRCRAVENTVYLAGVSTAPHPEVDYPAWGHTMWVDPYGQIMGEAQREEAILRGRFHRQRLQQVRQALPFLKARRPELYERW